MIMNRKIYIQPEIEVVEINVQQHLMALSDPTPPGVSPAPRLDFSDEELLPDLSGMPGM